MMKKKDYQKPTTQVVKLQQQSIICSSPYSVSAKGRREQLDDDTENLGW